MASSAGVVDLYELKTDTFGLDSEKMEELTTKEIKEKDIDVLTVLAENNPLVVASTMHKNPEVAKRMLATETDWKVAKLYSLTHYSLPDDDFKEFFRQAATRVVMRRGTQEAGRGLVRNKMIRTEYRPGLDIDIEQTLENFIGKEYLEYEDIVGIDRVSKEKSAVLMLDVSGSMGDKTAMAAMCVATMAYNLQDDEYGVLAFTDRVVEVKPINEDIPVEEIIQTVLELRPTGRTNIELALRVGQRELAKSKSGERFGILVSDGYFTSGGSPVPVASGFRRLHVIGVGKTSMLAREMARAGHGQFTTIDQYADIPKALSLVTR